MEENIISSEDMILNIDINTIEKIKTIFPFLISLSSNNKIEFLNDIDNENKKENYNPSKILIDSYANINESLKEIIEINNLKLPTSYVPDYTHGTQVSTLISINDFFNNIKFKDNLGIFKVKHFGIIPFGEISLTYTIKKLKKL